MLLWLMALFAGALATLMLAIHDNPLFEVYSFAAVVLIIVGVAL